MPPINQPSIRLQVIDKCLSNRHRNYTARDIMERVNDALTDAGCGAITKSTFYYDLASIQSNPNLEIERRFINRQTFLRYKDEKASIYNYSLKESEITKVHAAIEVLSRFSGMPQFEWINEIVPILEDKIGKITKSNGPIISFESNIDYKGTEFISPLFHAILSKRVLKIKYKSFKSDEVVDFEVHPQYLKQYNSRWFLLSYFEEWGDKPINHALDRICSIEESSKKYRTIKDFNWEEDYFADIIGVSRNDGQPTEIKFLIIDEEQAKYIETKPLHRSQKLIKKVEGGYETSIKVIPNYELEKLILSFGDRIKILAPSEFKLLLSKKIFNLFNLY